MQIKKITAFIVMLAMVLNIMPAFNITISADEETIEQVITTVSPKSIVPVHTENANWFDKYSDINVVKDCEMFFV